jgi:hypothetical protein
MGFLKTLICDIFHKQTRVARTEYASFDQQTGVSSSCTSYSYACATCEPEKLARLRLRALEPNPAVDREVAIQLERQHQEMLLSASPSVRRKLSV